MLTKESLRLAALPLLLAGAGLLGFSMLSGVKPETEPAPAPQKAHDQTAEAITPASTPPAHYHVDFPGSRSVDMNVGFVSNTEFETINGTVDNTLGSQNMWGHLDFDAVKGTGNASFRVSIAAMRTGDSTRDEHMRGFMNAEKHPDILFDLKSMKHLTGDQYQADGVWKMNGVEKPVSFTARISHIPGAKADQSGLNWANEGEKPSGNEWFRVQATFPVKMSDHGIELSGPAKAKVSDTWSVTVNFYGRVTMKE
jgi:polyisoprenoid-binding protein YceI